MRTASSILSISCCAMAALWLGGCGQPSASEGQPPQVSESLTPQTAANSLGADASREKAQDKERAEDQEKDKAERPSLDAAALIAAACSGCHTQSPAGEPQLGIPSTTVQPASTDRLTQAELIERLKAFRADEVPSTVMGRLMKGYTDADIGRLAQHFSPSASNASQ